VRESCLGYGEKHKPTEPPVSLRALTGLGNILVVREVREGRPAICSRRNLFFFAQRQRKRLNQVAKIRAIVISASGSMPDGDYVFSSG
jgi:hypothetical protein